MIPARFALVGFLCAMFIGAAMMASRVYMFCVLGYVLLFAMLALFGVMAHGWTLDLIIMAGAVLGIFGVARGFAALSQEVWKA